MLQKSKINLATDFNEDEVAAITPKPLSTKDQLVIMYKTGVSVKQIAAEFNISIGKVYEVLKRKQVTLRQGRNVGSKSAKRIMTMTTMQKENLISDYRSGMQLADIYSKYNINKHGAYSILDEYNVPRRGNPDLHKDITHNNARKKKEEQMALPAEILAMVDQRIANMDVPVETKLVDGVLEILVKPTTEQSVREVRLVWD